MRKFTCRILLGLSLAIACQSVSAQAMYRLKPLTLTGCANSYLDVFGFNENDEVAGNGCNANGDYHALLWKNAGTLLVDLGPNEPGSESDGYALNAPGVVTGEARDSTGEFGFVSSGDGTPMKKIPNGVGGTEVNPRAINELGQVTGAATKADGAYHAFLWKNDGSPMRDLGTLGGYGINSAGLAINASGEIAGVSDPPGGSDGRENHAVVWKNYGGSSIDLGTLGGVSGRAAYINASGQASGDSASRNFSRYRGFIWKNNGTPIHDLGSLGGAETFAAALNDAGQIAGSSDTYRWTKAHAFVWMNDGTPMKDLGTLGGTLSSANDINASGQVTGDAWLAGDAVSHAFIWRNDGAKIQDLNALIDPLDPLKSHVTLTRGHFINDKGDVVAEGVDSRTNQLSQYLLQGTVLTLNPRSLDFGKVPIHTTRATKSVTMTNTSPKVVAITGIALTGTVAGQFAFTSNCGSSLVGHATCAIKVQFKPTTKGAKSAFLNVNGGGGGLRSVSLKGTGT